ncbi:hypothetical protein SAY87_030021 [Trapa incisa]|uniref:BZIP domain-containing protein n=1 Tax=Trapa incisa TaxID=236973 RepID=A0AAN7Q9X7_9MYRT|nr:hypothetical protein SAY87_030021 [Trapa incisa]
MAKIEMDTAEARADLVHLSAGESGCGSIGEVSGRGRKRVNTKSWSSLTELNLANSAPPCSDLSQQYRKENSHNTIHHPKLEECAETFDESHACTTDSVPLGGAMSRPRENLSEAEKEAKRLRRILANRESARRTIRHRQALFEELTRKAFELTEENEKLKKGMETAMIEFQNLETKNKRLKAEAVKAAGHKLSRRHELKHVWTEMPASHLNFPLFLHSSPFASCLWPSLVQSPSITQPYQVLSTLPSVPANAIARACDQPHQKAMLSITGPRTHVYMPADPQGFTLSNQKGQCEPSRCKSERDEHVSTSSSRSADSSGNCVHVLPAPVKPKEASGAVSELLIIDLNEIPVESPEDHQCDHYLECCVEEGAIKLEQASSSGGEITWHDSKTKVVELLFTSDNLSLAKKDVESVDCSSDKRTVGTTVAAMGRRGKEITKVNAVH